MPSIPQNKEELTKAIQIAFDNLISDYSEIPEEYSRDIGVEGNIKDTKISVCDTLAYLIGWGKLVLKWYDLRSRKKEIDFPETGYKWNELGKLANHFHVQFCDWSYKDLLSEFQSITEQILHLIDSLGNEELYAQGWYKNYSLGRMIQFNTSSPMKNVRTKVRRFKKQSVLSKTHK